MSPVLLNAGLILVNVILALWALNKLKLLLTAGMLTVTKETELQGENVHVTAAYYHFQSKDGVFKRIQKIGEAAQARKAFMFERYENVVREAEQAQKVAKLERK